MNTRQIVRSGFTGSPKEISIDLLTYSKKLEVNRVLTSAKFQCILASIKAVGIIEPLIVFPVPGGQYVILDGHVRLEACKRAAQKTVPCLIAKDDESYTYNRRVNRLATVQEHLMIKRAIHRGLCEEKLAEALNVDVSHIKRKARLLDGICPEVVELLQDVQFPTKIAEMLKLMKSARQVEVVEMMLSANQITTVYCKAFLMATPPEFLVEQKKAPRREGLSVEAIERMEREMGSLNQRYKMVEQSYGQDALTLILLRGYVSKILSNDAVVRFLYKRRSDLLSELQLLVKSELDSADFLQGSLADQVKF